MGSPVGVVVGGEGAWARRPPRRAVSRQRPLDARPEGRDSSILVFASWPAGRVPTSSDCESFPEINPLKNAGEKAVAVPHPFSEVAGKFQGGAGIVSTAEERAVAAIRSIAPVVRSLPPGLADNLKRDIATAINHAVAEDRAGLQDTLRLCAVAFDEVLASHNLPHHQRAALRLCLGLCLSALTEGKPTKM